MLVPVGLLLIVCGGLLLTLIIVPKLYPLARLGLAFVLGLGIMTVLLFGGLLLGIAPTQTNVFVFFLALIFFFSIILRKKVVFFLGELGTTLSLSGLRKLSLGEKGLVLAIFALNLYALVTSLYWPVHAWDALTLYDFRGKILASPESALAYIRGEFNWFYYGYPLLTSLSHTLIYLFGGQNPLFLGAIFYLAWTVMFYGALREFSPRLISLLLTFLLLTHFQVIRQVILAYANLPYAVFFSLGTIYLLIWMVKRKEGYFFSSCLLVGLAVWTRDQEPFWLANLGVLSIYAFRSKKFLYPFIFLLVVAVPRLFWGAFKDKIAGPIFLTSDQWRNSFNILMQIPDWERIRQVAVFLYEIISGSWGPVLLLLGVLLVLDYKDLRRTKNLYLLLFVSLNFIFLAVGTYILSFAVPKWREIPDSLARISIAFYPLLLYFVANSATIKKIFGGEGK